MPKTQSCPFLCPYVSRCPERCRCSSARVGIFFANLAQQTLMHTGTSGNTLRYLLNKSRNMINILGGGILICGTLANRCAHFAASDWLERALQRCLCRLQMFGTEPARLVDAQAVVAPLERRAFGRPSDGDRQTALVRLAILCPTRLQRFVPDLEHRRRLERR